MMKLLFLSKDTSLADQLTSELGTYNISILLKKNISKKDKKLVKKKLQLVIIDSKFFSSSKNEKFIKNIVKHKIPILFIQEDSQQKNKSKIKSANKFLKKEYIYKLIANKNLQLCSDSVSISNLKSKSLAFFPKTKRKSFSDSEDFLERFKPLASILMNNLESGIFVSDLKVKKIVYMNKVAKDFFGDAIGKSCKKVFCDKVNTTCNFCQEENLTPSIMKTHQILDEKGQNWYEIKTIFISNLEDRKLFMHVVNDISKKKQVNNEIIISNQTFSSILSNLGASIYVADMNSFEVLYANKYCEENFGNANGKKCYELIYNKKQQCSFCTNSELLDAKNKAKDAIVWEFKNPISKKWSQVRDKAIKWTDDRYVRLQIGIDITDRRKAEENLFESEKRFRSLFENVPVSLWDEDFSLLKKFIDKKKEEGVSDFKSYFQDHPEDVYNCVKLVRINNVNNATLEIYKAKDKNQLLSNLERIFTNKSYEVFKEEIIALAEGKTTFRAEMETRNVVGEKNYTSFRLALPSENEHDWSRILISITDISERKKIEVELKKSFNEQNLIFDTAPIGIAFIRNSKLIRINPKMSELFGYPTDKLIGKTQEHLFPSFKEYMQHEEAATPVLKQGKIYSKEIQMIHKKGHLFWCHIYGKAIIAKDVSQGVLWVLEDITRKRISDEKLISILDKTQKQATELLIANKKLKQGSRDLKNTELKLRNQQLELQLANQKLKRKSLEINEKADALELSGQYKSDFLANMSHELRSPLNVIMLLSQYLAKNKTKHLNEKEIYFANGIYSSGKDLLELINDVLDLSKIEAGRMEVHLEDISLQEILNYAKRNYEQLAKEKGISLLLKLENDLPEFIQTDGQRLKQIIKNFLSNAIKFTSKGSVSFHIEKANRPSLKQENNSKLNNAIAFSISDTGPGIAEKEQNLVFEAFRQVDGSPTRKYGGTGLGLSISQRLSSLLNGEIILESTLGKGSTFTLLIPIYWNENKKLISSKTADNSSATKTITTNKGKKDFSIFQDKKILIVDDDKRNILAMENLLLDKNMQIFSCNNGQESIDFLKTNPEINMVLMDIMMPVMDGYEAMKRIRANKKICDIKIIALTAKAMKGDKEKCLAAGANDYINKPVDIHLLFEIMAKWF